MRLLIFLAIAGFWQSLWARPISRQFVERLLSSSHGVNWSKVIREEQDRPKYKRLLREIFLDTSSELGLRRLSLVEYGNFVLDARGRFPAEEKRFYRQLLNRLRHPKLESAIAFSVARSRHPFALLLLAKIFREKSVSVAELVVDLTRYLLAPPVSESDRSEATWYAANSFKERANAREWSRLGRVAVRQMQVSLESQSEKVFLAKKLKWLQKILRRGQAEGSAEWESSAQIYDKSRVKKSRLLGVSQLKWLSLGSLLLAILFLVIKRKMAMWVSIASFVLSSSLLLMLPVFGGRWFPKRVRFIILYRTQTPGLPASYEFPQVHHLLARLCRSQPGPLPSTQPDQFGECAAKELIRLLNQQLSSLEQPLDVQKKYVFESLEYVQNNEHFYSLDTAQTVHWGRQQFAVPGYVTVVVADSNAESVGGRARSNRRFYAENVSGLPFMLLFAYPDPGGHTFTHEMGHIMGLEHSSDNEPERIFTFNDCGLNISYTKLSLHPEDMTCEFNNTMSHYRFDEILPYDPDYELYNTDNTSNYPCENESGQQIVQSFFTNEERWGANYRKILNCWLTEAAYQTN